MYMAVHSIQGRARYTIRESYYDARMRCMRSRDLIALDRDPSRLVVYPSHNSFYIDESLTDRVESLSTDFDLCELEELFWPYIRNDVRERMAPYHCRGLRRRAKERAKTAHHHGKIHLFDKRRLYYLRHGVADQSRIGRLPAKYFQQLQDKSRDEIEQYLLRLEQLLKPLEYKRYVYVIFDLQRHFPTPLAASMPYALDQDELDKSFIIELCRLHADKQFWTGMELRGDRLHGYLIRYAIMFFDYQFGRPATWEEYLRDFMDRRRAHRPPSGRSTTMNRDAALEVFGLTAEKFSSMSKQKITKLFRKKAHEAHPDKGGDHDAFVRLVEAYNTLLKRKK